MTAAEPRLVEETELERAAYSAADARKLAQRLDIDLHGAIALLERGCPPEVALQILL